MTDLKNNWRDYKFTLHNIKIENSFSLKRKNEQQKYDLDNLSNYRYSLSKRVLTAKAEPCSDMMNSLYLGIPKNKRCKHTLKQADSFDLIIEEQQSEDIKYGYIGMNKEDKELLISEELFLEFYIPSNLFNLIENLLRIDNTEIEISVHKKGWYCLGAIGDQHLYMDTENLELILLSSIRQNKKISESFNNEIEINAKNDEIKLEEEVIHFNNNIIDKLFKLESSLSALKVFLWIITILLIINITIN